MTGYYYKWCQELPAKQWCDAFIHLCSCGAQGLVWEDGWVECYDCAKQRLIEGRLH